MRYAHEATNLTDPVASSSNDCDARGHALELAHADGRTRYRSDMTEKGRSVHQATEAAVTVGGGITAVVAVGAGGVGNA